MATRATTPPSSLRQRGGRQSDDSGKQEQDVAKNNHNHQSKKYVELKVERFQEITKAYGAVDADGKYHGFWSDPFCMRDFRCAELSLAMPRVLLAIVFFLAGLFTNSLSQVWLQNNLSGYYERLCPGEGLSAEDKSLWDITFRMLPRVPSTYWADVCATLGPLVVLFRFIILPGPCSMRWTILRRWLTVWGLIWFIRAITIFVTPLPNPDHTCKPILSAPHNFLMQAFYIMTQQDLTCQDVMFSGHTVALTLSMKMLLRYRSLAPWSSHGMSKDWMSINTLVSVLGRIFMISGYYFIAGSRFHYTLDVLVAYLVTSATFYAYHDRIELTWLRQEHGGSDSLDGLLHWLDKYAKDRTCLTKQWQTKDKWLEKH